MSHDQFRFKHSSRDGREHVERMARRVVDVDAAGTRSKDPFSCSFTRFRNAEFTYAIHEC